MLPRINQRPQLASFAPTAEIATLIAAVALAVCAYVQLLSPKWGTGAIFLLVAWTIWRVRDQAASILCVFLGVLLVGSLVSAPRLKLWDASVDGREIEELAVNWAESGSFNPDLPVIVHLVFDEMMSPGAMPEDVPGTSEIRARSYRLGREAGFRVYDSIFARNFFSAISLPNVFGPEYLGHSRVEEVVTEQQPTLRDNAYFADLGRRGYRTAVFQSAHVNFCDDSNVDLCETFDSFDPGRSGHDGKDMRSQVTVLAQTLLRAYQPSHLSAIGAAALAKVSTMRLGIGGVLGIADRYDVQGFPQWFDRVNAFAARAPRGSHIFAHFVVPHAPYLLTDDCVIDGTFDAGYYLASRFAADDREPKRAEYYAAYLKQVGCVHTKIEQLLNSLGSLNQYRDAVIVIHGDHGARISNGNTLEDLSPQDFLDNYGTFFAVRKVGIEPGIDCTFASLGEVFRQHLASTPPTHREDEPLPVMVMSREASGARVEAPMPRFGCATDEH